MRFVRGEDAAPGEDVPDGGEPEVGEQAAELALGAVGIDGVPELAQPAHAHSGLVDVQLPGMQVDDGGLVLARVQAPDEAPGEPVGEEPEISAPRDGNPTSQDGDGGKGKLGDPVSVGDGHTVWEAGGVRDTVPIVNDGEDARVVEEAGLPEDLEALHRLPHHR